MQELAFNFFICLKSSQYLWFDCLEINLKQPAARRLCVSISFTATSESFPVEVVSQDLPQAFHFWGLCVVCTNFSAGRASCR